MSDYKLKSMEAVGEILKAYVDESREGPWSIGYSGGKDSTVMTALIFKALLLLTPDQRNRKIIITTSQTHLDLVTDILKQEEINKMRFIIKKHDLPIEIAEVEAEIRNSFLYLVVGRGYPLPKSRMNRWCTERLKIVPQQKFMKQLNPSLTAIGVRMSESETRRQSIESHQTSEFYSNNTFMPIVNFTLDDVWTFLKEEGMPWGGANQLSQVYKDATGECGLSKRKAGANEKTDDPCGARTGCIICPVVTIDKSSQEFAKTHPWLQPYVELRNIIIAMYKDSRNKAGRMRDGTLLEYGKGTFTVKARMKLYELIRKAEEDNKYLALLHGAQPQKLIYNEELDALIQNQWDEDLRECPWVEDAMEVGRYYESKIKGLNGFQVVWNHHFDTKETVNI